MPSPTPPHPASSQPSIPRLPPLPASRTRSGPVIIRARFLHRPCPATHTRVSYTNVQMTRCWLLHLHKRVPTAQTAVETHGVPCSHAQTCRLTSLQLWHPRKQPSAFCTCTHAHNHIHSDTEQGQVCNPRGFTHGRLSTPNLLLSPCMCVHTHVDLHVRCTCVCVYHIRLINSFTPYTQVL